MDLCTPDTIVNADLFEGEIFPLRCKRWSCPHCAQINRKKVMMAARDGNPNTFLTLTCKPDLHETPDEAAQDMVRGLRLLRRRIQRKWGIDKLPFIVVFEKTKKGWPHMHLLIRAPYMHWKVLRRMWESITGAFEVDIRYIKKRAQIMFYVTKYIGKDLFAFDHCKRWWRSHNYKEAKDEWQPARPWLRRPRRATVTIGALQAALVTVGAHVERERADKLYFKWRDQKPRDISAVINLARQIQYPWDRR